MNRSPTKHLSENPFTEDYFENGIKCGLSCYENYRWLPELTIPMVEAMVRHLGITRDDAIMDFGCAKGYVVQAFRQLDYRAWGVDISPYAIAQSDEDTRPFLYLAGTQPANWRADWVLAKDVLEHLDELDCLQTLRYLRHHGRKLFIAVPLGNEGKYTIPEMERDVTHKIRKPLWWWTALCEEAGWKITSSGFKMAGVKDKWVALSAFGNGFVWCE